MGFYEVFQWFPHGFRCFLVVFGAFSSRFGASNWLLLERKRAPKGLGIAELRMGPLVRGLREDQGPAEMRHPGDGGARRVGLLDVGLDELELTQQELVHTLERL